MTAQERYTDLVKDVASAQTTIGILESAWNEKRQFGYIIYLLAEPRDDINLNSYMIQGSLATSKGIFHYNQGLSMGLTTPKVSQQDMDNVKEEFDLFLKPKENYSNP